MSAGHREKGQSHGTRSVGELSSFRRVRPYATTPAPAGVPPTRMSP
jgi:hypothetical protein